jgi:hypothetical protein
LWALFGIRCPHYLDGAGFTARTVGVFAKGEILAVDGIKNSSIDLDCSRWAPSIRLETSFLAKLALNGNGKVDTQDAAGGS